MHNKLDNSKLDLSTVTSIVSFEQLNKQLLKCFNENTEILVSPAVIKLLKDTVTTIDNELKNIYEESGDANAIVFGRSNLTDQLIKTIYDYLFQDLDQQIALIAVGGYGRGELHPKSDIDLMILLEAEENQTTKELLEQFLTLLWDVRLEIGHSVRTVKECVEEATKDITVATNIMESRLLAGSELLFNEMKASTGPTKIWDAKSFFQRKLEEQIQRNGKYNDTAYNLEPNIKESHGGLRDIQMIGWVAKRHFETRRTDETNSDKTSSDKNVSDNMGLQDLVTAGFLLQSELDTLLNGQQLLWRIRCSLHYLAGRREDRLLFDYQRDLALEFGFSDDKDNPKNEAIEQFMQQYYRTVIELERLNEMLLQHFREAIIYANVENEAEILNNSFQVRNGYIETRNENVFKDNPCALLEIFTLLQEYPEIQGVRATSIREIRNHLHLINNEFRKSKRAHQLFIKIITGSRGVTHELRRMNRYGILAAYIPAFDSIVGRMQYDLFHAYTVDQHTLFVIRNMRRLSVPDYCHEFPLASGVFQHLSNPGLLYLAGLFHDIAKGRPGDHAEVGAVDAKEFCEQHTLPKKDGELVSWLVKNHLNMSMTAQQKDINDPDVLIEFAKHVATLERLDYLYLLTICDIRGTNPTLWNDWKEKLLAELYNKTAALINKGLNLQSDKESNIIEIQTASLRRLEHKGINSHQANELWETLNPEYFQSHTFGQITWHTSLIINAKQNQQFEKPLVKARVHESSNSIQVLIYMIDREYIFYDVVTELTNSEVDIVNAHVVNTSDGYALQSYRLTPVSFNSSEILQEASERIVNQLQEKLNNTTEMTQASLRSSSKHKFFPSPTIVSFNDMADNNATQITIETVDRTGVLATIAKTFADCETKLLNAKIATAGEKALDSFTISTIDNQPLSETQRDILRERLKKSL